MGVCFWREFHLTFFNNNFAGFSFHNLFMVALIPRIKKLMAKNPKAIIGFGLLIALSVGLVLLGLYMSTI
jgi:hypothetical protein